MANDRSVARLRAADPITEAGDLQTDNARQREEILRLRDLLIARDAELGKARGQIAEMEHHARFLYSAMARIKRFGGGPLLSAGRRLLLGKRR